MDFSKAAMIHRLYGHWTFMRESSRFNHITTGWRDVLCSHVKCEERRTSGKIV